MRGIPWTPVEDRILATACCAAGAHAHLPHRTPVAIIQRGQQVPHTWVYGGRGCPVHSRRAAPVPKPPRPPRRSLVRRADVRLFLALVRTWPPDGDVAAALGVLRQSGDWRGVARRILGIDPQAPPGTQMVAQVLVEEGIAR
jgi:hypothetical protein